MAAATGGQQAAKLHFLVERNKNSADPAKRGMAINAGSALSYWNLELPVQPRDASRRSSYETAPVWNQEGVNANEQQVKAPPPIDLESRQFPVSLESSARDFDAVAAEAAQAAMLNAETTNTEESAGTVNQPPSTPQPAARRESGTTRDPGSEPGTQDVPPYTLGASTSSTPSATYVPTPKDRPSNERVRPHSAQPTERPTKRAASDEPVAPLCSFEPLAPPGSKEPSLLSMTTKYRKMIASRRAP